MPEGDPWVARLGQRREGGSLELIVQNDCSIVPPRIGRTMYVSRAVRAMLSLAAELAFTAYQAC